MNELTAALKEELNVDTAFTLPIFGGIDIPESIAVSWGIMAFLVIVSILLTRNLKVNHISKRQAILETAVVTMDNFFKDLLGEAGKQYVPYLITVALYIACSNLIGIIGLKPPTKDLNVTAALAIMSIVLIEYSGIHAKGGKRFVHSLAEPIALMTPIYMHGMIFGAMTESYCAEQSARMTAMDSATKSATDMIHALQLEYNRTRQGAITQEITEIIGGASAVQTSDY